MARNELNKSYSPIITNAFILATEMTLEMPGYEKEKDQYTDLSTVEETTKAKLKRQCRAMLRKYSHQMKTLLDTAEQKPGVYLTRYFKKHLCTISSHFGYLHARTNNYQESENHFLIALLHERNTEKRQKLYTALVTMQKEQSTRFPQESPTYIETVFQLLQEGYEINSRKPKDSALLTTFLSLPLSSQEKLNALNHIFPRNEHIVYHYILKAYLCANLDNISTAKECLKNAEKFSKDIQLSQFFDELVAMTTEYIHETNPVDDQ